MQFFKTFNKQNSENCLEHSECIMESPGIFTVKISEMCSDVGNVVIRRFRDAADFSLQPLLQSDVKRKKKNNQKIIRTATKARDDVAKLT